MEAVDNNPPHCTHGHGEMILRERTTPEQEWCGTWYDCPPGPPGETCGSSALLPSKALLDSYGGK